MSRSLTVFVLLVSCPEFVAAAVQTKTITYKHGDLECRGFLAWDDAVQGTRPGVLVVHEWWGLNDYARSRAQQLAQLGYVAFAADIYGEGKTTTHPADAGKMASAVRSNIEDWRQRAQAALTVLCQQPQCDTTKLAAIGYCFGGSTVLQLAYSGAELRAVATFHAALPAASASDAGKIQAEILVCHGADDGFVSADSIKSFKEALKNAEVKLSFISYPGARHSFTVRSADKVGIAGLKYNQPADQASWREMRALFARRLGK